MMARFRHTVASAKIAAIGWGLSVLGQRTLRQGALRPVDHRGIVVMFHHVRPRTPVRLESNLGIEVTPETLEHVLCSLRAQGYDIVPMDAVPERLSRRSSSRFAALTFDDGSRDLLEHAARILVRHAAPFIVNVTTGFADGTVAPWWHVAERAVLALRELVLDLGEGPCRLTCATQAEKEAAATDLHELLWRASETARADAVTSLAAQAGIDLRAMTRELYMDWAELAALSRLPGCAIGAHTLTHPKLAELDTADAAREIALPRDIIRERLGREVRHIAYPYGGCEACGPREFALAREAGYVTGVTTRRGLTLADSELLELERVPINGHFQGSAMLEALVSGAPMMLERQARALAIRARAAAGY